MVIDDKTSNLLAYKAIFESYFPDYKIITANSGVIGIKRAINEQPEVILLDIVMRGMSGYEVCKQLKKLALTQSIPVVFLTASTVNTKDRIYGFGIGAYAYVSKPIDPTELAAQTKVMLRIKEAEDLLRIEKSNLEKHVIERTSELTETNKYLKAEVIKRKKAEKKVRQSHQKLLKLSMHIEEMREKERTQIALDLHDDLGQQLTVLDIELARIKSKLANGDIELLSSKLNSVTFILSEAIKSVQKISTDLRPCILDDLGLEAAIDWQLKEFETLTGIKYQSTISVSEYIIAPGLSILIFRIVQEALTNITRHSNASFVKLNMRTNKDKLILIITDNGIGMTSDKIENSDSFGLVGMRERVRWGGKIDIKGTKGTEIRVRMPLRKTIKND